MTIRKLNTSKLSCATVIAAVAGALSVACGSSLPPKELVEARSAYIASANGPAAAETPAQVHTAKTALDEAERAFADDGDEPHVRDKAYIALRKAQLADASAQLRIAQKAKTGAEEEADRLQADALRRTQADLASSQQNLSRTEEQLGAERQARAEAEQKHAQAMSDLQRIASVKQETRGMVITLSGSVLFATNQSTLLPAAVVKMNDVAEALTKGNPDANITIEGHTDSQGTRDYNVQLGQRRAEAVKAQLASHGVAADRIKAVGVGPDRPVADNKSAEGRANNRRVEIVVEGSNGSSSAGSSRGSAGGTDVTPSTKPRR